MAEQEQTVSTLRAYGYGEERSVHAAFADPASH